MLGTGGYTALARLIRDPTRRTGGGSVLGRLIRDPKRRTGGGTVLGRLIHANDSLETVGTRPIVGGTPDAGLIDPAGFLLLLRVVTPCPTVSRGRR